MDFVRSAYLKDKTEIIQARLTVEQKNAVSDMAYKLQCSISDIVRMALDELLASRSGG